MIETLLACGPVAGMTVADALLARRLVGAFISGRDMSRARFWPYYLRTTMLYGLLNAATVSWYMQGTPMPVEALLELVAAR